ncbi:MAG TPA: hypothetical protein VFN53_00680 [Acidobacteriaceae bacterium]|nr:hypothetical protein [Acidobacteriaceae bacterium]
MHEVVSPSGILVINTHPVLSIDTSGFKKWILGSPAPAHADRRAIAKTLEEEGYD